MMIAASVLVAVSFLTQDKKVSLACQLVAAALAVIWLLGMFG